MTEQARKKLDAARTFVKQTEKTYEPHAHDWGDWEKITRECDELGSIVRKQTI